MGVLIQVLPAHCMVGLSYVLRGLLLVMRGFPVDNVFSRWLVVVYQSQLPTVFCSKNPILVGVRKGNVERLGRQCRRYTC